MARLQREGFRSGITDYMLPVPLPYSLLEPPRAGLWLELKRVGSSPSDVRPEQQVFMADMQQLGYEARAVNGAEAAQTAITGYLSRTGYEVVLGYARSADWEFAKRFYARRVRDFGASKL